MSVPATPPPNTTPPAQGDPGGLVPPYAAPGRPPVTLARRIGMAIVTGWINKIVGIVLQVIFIRVLFDHLIKEEQGFWLLLGNSSVFVFLLDFGFSQVLTRRIALSRGKSGADPHAPLSEETLADIGDLVATARRVYRVLSVLIFVVSSLLGLLFLRGVEYHEVKPETVWLAWIVLCAGYALSVWAQMWLCLINGLGLVSTATIVDTVIAVITLVTQIVLVYMGCGIVPLAAVAAVMGLVARQINLIAAKKTHPEVFRLNGKWNGELFRFMVSPSLRAWCMMLGAFLILKTDQYFISARFGTKDLPDYNAAFSVVYNLCIFSVSLASGASVYVSHLWQSGELKQVHALVKRTARMGMLLMVCGAACLAIAGRPLLELWLPRGTFIGYPILWVFCVMFTLETHHVIVAYSSRATEDEAFAVPAVTAGILNLILTFIFIRMFGLFGVALGTLVAQMVTNNWYVVYRGLRRLKMSIWEHVLGVMLPVAGIFVIALAIGLGGEWVFLSFGSRALHAVGLRGAADWLSGATGMRVLQLLGAMCGTGSVLAVSMWLYGLSASQRDRISAFLRFHPTT